MAQVTYDHVAALVHDVTVVGEADAFRGTIELAELAEIWAEPAAGCLLPAVREVIAEVDDRTGIVLVVCGGNMTVPEFVTYAR